MTTSLTMRLGSLAGLAPPSPPPGYALRTYRDGDAAAWCEIMEGAIDRGWTPERFYKEMVAPEPFDREGLFFATHGGRPVATACAWRLPDRYGPDTGVLHMVAVHPAHRGRRLGRCVSLAVLHYFRAHGLHDAVLHTDDSRLPAIKTYLGLGFQPVLASPETRAAWERVTRLLGLHAGSA